MKNRSPSRWEEALNLSFDQKNEPWLTSGYTLRKLIGVLGMALPALLWLNGVLVHDWGTPLPSLSHYYYTRAGSLFTITLSLLAVFLIVYKGPERIDFYLSFLAGVSALCVVLFPTSNLAEGCCDASHPYSVTFIPERSSTDTRVAVHYVAAGIFLLSLAYMSLFLFTRSPVNVKERGRNKRLRNRIYVICGAVMVAAVLIIFTGDYLEWIPRETYEGNHLTFWMETMAVEAFGLSWLVKGEAILKD
jgi:formate hydrogenlyase subunit 3/multisubunit Na+/H+ antiporter MnhD subunit